MKLKTIIPVLAMPSLLALPAWCQDDDPFGGADEPDREPTREELFGALPKLIQVQVEWIEMSHETVTDLMFERDPTGDSTELRRTVQNLIKEEKAEVLETAICLARPGQKATTESIREHIYPTEYEPPELPNVVRFEGEHDAAAISQISTPATPTAFETRNVGTTLEIEPNIGADDRVIDLRFSPEIVIATGNTHWQSTKDGLGNDHRIEMPLFYSMRTSTGLTLIDGQYRFAGLLTPQGEDGESDRTRKVMVFIKCDVVAIGEEALEEALEE